MAVTGLNLSDVILHVSDEIRKASADANRGDPVMVFSGCDIELAVTVAAEAGGGIKFWLIDASTKIQGERVSTVKLSFSPTGAARQYASVTPDKGPPVKPRPARPA